jgi:hypothetical protein
MPMAPGKACGDWLLTMGGQTEETPVTDVTTSQGQEQPMSSCCASLPSEPAPAG